MVLDTPLSKISGIGPAYLSRLSRLGIKTAGDLIYHFPFRYEDLSLVRRIAEAKEGEVVTIRGQIWEISSFRTARGKFLTKALINDGTGSLPAVWFNQPYLTKTLKTGHTVSLAGKVTSFGGQLTMTAPDYELGTPKSHTGRIVPIYPETEGLSSKWLRSKVNLLIPELISSVEDFLPVEIKTQHQLDGLSDSLVKIHRPQSWSEVEAARRRLEFEELWLFQLAALIRKREWQKSRGKALEVDQEKVVSFMSNLPFELTSAQRRVTKEILADLAQDKPMNRLLMGDVGSGKTVVAAIAGYITHLNGFQVAFMAPTEILATQHFRTLQTILSPFGVSVGLRTGSTKTGPADITVGTHALIAKAAGFENLGLVVIDEQHRFGVAQRGSLKEKGIYPHLLTMTATPIPRTLALTIYGDLDLSVINELPPGRKVIKTYLTPKEKRDKAYQFIREKITSGEQAFIITPLIEPSETLTTLKSAKTEFQRLSEEVYPDLKLGLLHGQLKSQEKDAVLEKFRSGETQILVATPVVEVGIDVPNATVMVIEGADHFGLAQLHQLRGRIGRGTKESWCLLFSDSYDAEVNSRLKAMETHYLGPELAELDLKLRGPGEMYGLKQSGLPNLKIASLQDTSLISETRESAQKYLDKTPLIPSSVEERLEPMLKLTASSD